jgi:penicillin-binding protein 1A
LPPKSRARRLRPSEVTKVYADDGKTVIGELSLERRIPLASDEIPETMKKAILAIEDTRFDDHIGIDPIRLFAAAIEDIRRNRRAQGASTLTQQLARLLFLKPEKSFIRKIKGDHVRAPDRALLHKKSRS